MVLKLNSRWPETRVCCPKTLCAGHLENKGVVGTLPGIETQGSYVAVVFKLNSRWPETTVYCPETLCSGHLENKVGRLHLANAKRSCRREMKENGVGWWI